jgi:hypothetical protein
VSSHVNGGCSFLYQRLEAGGEEGARTDGGCSSLHQPLKAGDEEGAMPDYFQQAKDVLHGLRSFDVTLNVEQCEFLTTILTRFVDTVPFFDDGDGYSTSFGLAIGKEIYGVMKRAEWLVEECCNEHWLRKALEISASGEIGELLRSLAELLPYALSVELGVDPSRCDDQFLDAMKDLAGRHREGVWGEEVEAELVRRSRHDAGVLLSKVERMLGKVQVSEVAPDLGEHAGLAYLVRDKYSSVVSSDWLPPEMSGNISFDSVDVRGARIYTTLDCLGAKFSLLTLNLDCGCISDELVKEARLWKKWQHPYIVPLLGYWEVKPRPFLLYEFMNFNLETLITKVRAVRELMPLEVIEVMLPVAKAMKYLHDHGVAHRGLSTENILCNVLHEDFSMPLHDVTVKVMGFGEALEDISSAQERNWKMASITEFTAPETFLQGNRKIDFMKGDVFSFGKVLLKALTGQTDLDHLALGGEGPSVLQLGLESLNIAGMLPAALGGIIESSCHADPNMRPTFEDICSRLLLCKLQILSRKTAGVGSVRAAIIWRLHAIVVSILPLRNWMVLRRECLSLLAFLAVAVVMVTSIVLLDRAVWISNSVEFIQIVVVCIYFCFCAFYFTLRFKRGRLNTTEVQEIFNEESFQVQSSYFNYFLLKRF